LLQVSMLSSLLRCYRIILAIYGHVLRYPKTH